MSASRVPGLGAAIDRNRPVSFRFDGRRMLGYAGDTLASALLANGVGVVARSFKLHRPRGVMAAGVEEPNAFVRISAPFEEPNIPATMVPLVEGLEAHSVHAWPRAGFDVLAGLQAFARFLPAGFYYKTFIGMGGNAWPRFEPMIRRLAGLGPAPAAPDPLPSETRFDHVDALVVGAGPAGLAAATRIAEAGVSVLAVDDALTLHPDLDAAWRTLEHGGKVRLLRPAAALGLYHDRLVVVHERQPAEPFLRDRVRKVRAACVVLATGAVEQPLVVAGNDRPGVMLADAALRYIDVHGVRAGDRIAVISNNAEGLKAAARIADFGAELAGLVLLGDLPAPDFVSSALVHRPAKVSIRGGRRVRGLRLQGTDGRAYALACDAVLMSGGYQPTVQLWTQAGGRLIWSEAAQALLPAGKAEGVIICGGAAGTTDWESAAESGGRAGEHALAMLAGRAAQPAETFGGAGIACHGDLALPPVGGSGKAFVDFHNDVTADDIALARREGYCFIDHVKRYTTLGMGPDQGRTSARNGARLAMGSAPNGDIRTTTMRPPWRPVPFSAVAGTRAGVLASPFRTTPLTGWAKAKGAVMYESGADWRRPGYFPQQGETLFDAAQREARAVRERVGAYDSSPLGKILLKGRDSARFLDLVQAGRLSGMKPMTGRYALMLREDGRVFDDGVVFRDSDTQFTLTTTSGNAGAVLSWLEFVRTVHGAGLDLRLLDVTEQWADICVCGPDARALLSRLCKDVDLSREAFPFMAVRTGAVAGVSARIKRVSFTGELSYEIWVPRRHAAALWDAVFDAGRDFGIAPVGSEANHVLRVEKGYLSMGHEVDGFANPFDLGLGRLVAMDKPDFIGKRALLRDRSSKEPRPELIGLLPDDGQPLPEGAPVHAPDPVSPGFVTASVHSPVLGRGVALALFEGGRAMIGSKVEIEDGGRRRACAVTAPVFVDPEGARLRL